MTELRKTPLHAEHVALKGRLVPFAGFELPVQYSNLLDEHKAVRTQAGVFDVSHMGELFVSGAEAEAVLDALVTGDLSEQPIGKALYTVACNERGTILDDLIVYRLAADRFLVVCNASNRDKISAHVGAACRGRCDFRDASDDYALLALQGPRAVDVMGKMGGADAVALAGFQLAEMSLLGHKVIVARTGYTGEDGFEIFCGNDAAVNIWRACLAQGAVPCGLGARDTLRLEARLSLYGNDIDETTDPLSAGLGWVVKLNKRRPFLGKNALVALRESGPSRKMVGLEMTGRGIARHGYDIATPTGETVGIVTSGSPGPTVGKNIAMGYVAAAHAVVGSQVAVRIRDQLVPAVVVKTPFYKRPS